MINDDNQDVDFENNEEEMVEVEESEQEENTTDWEARAKKAEAILARNKGKKADEKPASKTTSDDFDYGQYAFMEQRGIETDDDIAFVKESMRNSGKGLREVLNANWFKTELKERQELSQTANATIKGKRSGGVAVDNVEYWAGKDFADVPVAMRGQVLAHREAKEKNKGQFYNQ